MLKKATKRDDINSQSSLSVAGVSMTCFHAKTSGSQSTEDVGSRQAPSNVSSSTFWTGLYDEIELWPSHILDIVDKRMQASPCPTKPVRQGSTPGPEGGLIDSRVKMAQHILQWRVVCPCCYREQFIDPFGNLLKEVEVEMEDGTKEMSFLSQMGKPLDWFYYDPEHKAETAYIGCRYRECEGELSRESLDNGEFACTKTGETAREIGDRALKSRKKISSIALRLPRLASQLFSASSQMIKFQELKNIKSLVDEVQQGLGKPFSIAGGKISLVKLKKCSGLPLPFGDREPDLKILGFDQGRYTNYVIVQHWYLFDSPNKEDRWRKAHKVISWWGKISFGDLDRTVAHHDIDIVAMDNEPNYNDAAECAIKHPPTGPSISTTKTQKAREKGVVYLIDQMDLKGVQFKRTERIRQNINNDKFHQQDTTVPVYCIDRSGALDAVRDRIYREQTHFPPDLDYDPRDDENLFKHYLTSDKLPTGQWLEAHGEPDHWFHADSMCEMVALASFYETGVKKGIAIGVVNL